MGRRVDVERDAVWHVSGLGLVDPRSQNRDPLRLRSGQAFDRFRTGSPPRRRRPVRGDPGSGAPSIRWKRKSAALFVVGVGWSERRVSNRTLQGDGIGVGWVSQDCVSQDCVCWPGLGPGLFLMASFGSLARDARPSNQSHRELWSGGVFHPGG